MAYISENGIVREMTAEEEKELFPEPCEVNENSNPLKEMAQAMSTATSLAQMRAAAKAFLTATEADETSEITV